MPNHLSLHRIVAVIVIAAQVSSCTGWRAETLAPAEVVERQRPGEIRVQYGDGEHEVLYQPEIQGDSLLARQDWKAKQPDRALALADVKAVATRQVSAARTAGLLLLGLGAIVGVVVGIGSIQGPFDNWGQ